MIEHYYMYGRSSNTNPEVFVICLLVLTEHFYRREFHFSLDDMPLRDVKTSG